MYNITYNTRFNVKNNKKQTNSSGILNKKQIREIMILSNLIILNTNLHTSIHINYKNTIIMMFDMCHWVENTNLKMNSHLRIIHTQEYKYKITIQE